QSQLADTSVICSHTCLFSTSTATPEIYTLSLHDALPISELIGSGLVTTGLAGYGAYRGLAGAGEAASIERGVAFFGRDNLKYYADRKSTRLNSSHVANSYAVFCLKKKNFLYSYSLSSLRD